jgi:hypothetical protein
MKGKNKMRAKVFRITQICSLLSCILILMAAGSAHALFIIDTFDDTNQLVNTFVSGPLTLPTATGEAVGNYRTMEMVSVNPSSGYSSLEADYTVTPDTLAFSNNDGVLGTARITWDANSVGLGGVDLTESGANSYLSIDVNTIDQGSVDLVFDITGTGAYGTATTTINNAAVGTFQVPFTSFTGYSNDIFANADNIVFTVSTNNAGSDLNLDFVYTSGYIPPPAVPEPSTLFLFGLGGFGILGYIWQRGRKKATIKTM